MANIRVHMHGIQRFISHFFDQTLLHKWDISQTQAGTSTPSAAITAQMKLGQLKREEALEDARISSCRFSAALSLD